LFFKVKKERAQSNTMLFIEVAAKKPNKEAKILNGHAYL
jgi:hypothetical protein